MSKDEIDDQMPALVDPAYPYVTCPNCNFKIRDMPPNTYFHMASELRKEFTEFRANQDAKIAELCANYDAKIAELCAKQDATIAELRADISELRDFIKNKL